MRQNTFKRAHPYTHTNTHTQAHIWPFNIAKLVCFFVYYGYSGPTKIDKARTDLFQDP